MSAFAWTFLSRTVAAVVSFLTVPLLITEFGSDRYGILVLASAANASLAMLDLGLTTGSVRYFSQWLAKGWPRRVEMVARTSLTFYGVVGLVNASVLIVLALWGQALFQVSPERFHELQDCLYLIAGFSIANWVGTVFSQLLNAVERVDYLRQLTLVKVVVDLVALGVTLILHLSLVQYFGLTLVSSLLTLAPQVWLVVRLGLLQRLTPACHWRSFLPILAYSLSMFALGIFQFIATRSRPIVLAMFSNQGGVALTEYRVIEVFTVLIISIGGAFVGILLPRASRIVVEGSRADVERFVYDGTRMTSIVAVLLGVPLFLGAKELLVLYVGTGYVHLAIWLQTWIVTILLYIHNQPAASLVLATGKNGPLVKNAGWASVLSLVVNALLCPQLGVGSAVIGYLVYITIQMGFYYAFYFRRVLFLDSLKLLKIFLAPTTLGLIIAIPLLFVEFTWTSPLSLFLQLGLKVSFWLVLFLASAWGLRIIGRADLRLITGVKEK